MKIESLGEAFDSRSNSLNAMRLLAALAVIYGHAAAVTGRGPGDIFLQYVGYKFLGGVAVDVFFVLSGFLITASAMSGKGVAYFLASRLLRIYPGLIVCVVLSVFVLGPALTVDGGYWQAPQTWSYFVGNITAYRTEYFLPGVFSTLHDPAINGSLWSLTLEIRLYLMVLIALLVGVFSSRNVFNTLFFGVLIVGYLVPDIFARVFPPEHHRHVAMMFMIGSFAWVNRSTIALAPGILLALLVFAAALHGTPKFGMAYALLLPYLVFYVAMGQWGLWFNRFGDYSYGTYLYGWPCQQLAMLAFPDISNLGNTLLASVLAVLLAMLSWHLVEKKSLRLKQRFRPLRP